MRKVRVSILLREDLVLDFRSRGLTSLSGAIEEFLEVFLPAIPPENRKRSAKETRELVRRFLEGRPIQETIPQEFLQQLITLLQTLPQPSQLQHETHQEPQPLSQPETSQEKQPPIPQKPKQKPRRKPKQN